MLRLLDRYITVPVLIPSHAIDEAVHAGRLIQIGNVEHVAVPTFPLDGILIECDAEPPQTVAVMRPHQQIVSLGTEAGNPHLLPHFLERRCVRLTLVKIVVHRILYERVTSCLGDRPTMKTPSSQGSQISLGFPIGVRDSAGYTRPEFKRVIVRSIVLAEQQSLLQVLERIVAGAAELEKLAFDTHPPLPSIE
nr:hypothetical protein [Altericroceibacterium xinjiangense]